MAQPARNQHECTGHAPATPPNVHRPAYFDPLIYATGSDDEIEATGGPRTNSCPPSHQHPTGSPDLEKLARLLKGVGIENATERKRRRFMIGTALAATALTAIGYYQGLLNPDNFDREPLDCADARVICSPAREAEANYTVIQTDSGAVVIPPVPIIVPSTGN